jgi:hypothetical protein
MRAKEVETDERREKTREEMIVQLAKSVDDMIFCRV